MFNKALIKRIEFLEKSRDRMSRELEAAECRIADSRQREERAHIRLLDLARIVGVEWQEPRAVTGGWVLSGKT